VDEGLKKRLIGATVLVSLAVIFVPMLLEHEPVIERGINKSNIPPRPEGRFTSRIIPLEDETPKASAKAVVKVQREKPVVKSSPAAPVKGAAQSQQPAELTSWVIQVGSFSSKENAEKLVADLRKERYPAFLDPVRIGSKTMYRVKVGPEVSRDKIGQMLKKLNATLKPRGVRGKLQRYP